MTASVIPDSRDVQRAEWGALLEAMQVSGLSAFVLRRQVAVGAVRIRKDRGGRYLYNLRDCERLRQAQIAAGKQA